MMNPLLAFGCFAVAGHAWGEVYTDWAGRKCRVCRWCDKTERA